MKALLLLLGSVCSLSVVGCAAELAPEEEATLGTDSEEEPIGETSDSLQATGA